MEDQHYWAKRAFDRNDQLHDELLKAALDSARDALKAALLLNGGACIALLGFLASITSKEATRASLMLLAPAKFGLTWFAAGAFLAAFGSGLAYICNSLYSGAAAEKDKRFSHPYIFGNKGSDRLYWWARAINWATVVVIFGSYSCFVLALGLIAYKF
ncbi:hypothetical protein [Brucella sp. NBRC 12953]|uniref:hypothetical protein n=1 Tax=Brucella sp. NBRC 12953 TaxID=3075481 RepID=UPI000DE2311C